MEKQVRLKKQQDEIHAIFEALSHPVRREILEFINSSGGQSTVEPIVEELRISWSSASKHLKVLMAAKLLNFYKQGNHRIYRLEKFGLKMALDWIEEQKKTVR